MLLTVLAVGWKAHRVAAASALCKAARAGDVAAVRKLLAEGADPNELNAMGYAKMRVEQGQQNAEVIAILAGAGAKDQRTKSEGRP